MNDTDKIVAAIDRNTETLRSLKNEVGGIGCIALLLWLGICVVGCPRAKAAPLLPPLPEPPALQYWYTVDVPRDGGVYPLEVYAPALPRIEPLNLMDIGDPPKPPVHVPEPGTWVAMALAVGTLWALALWGVGGVGTCGG